MKNGESIYHVLRAILPSNEGILHIYEMAKMKNEKFDFIFCAILS